LFEQFPVVYSIECLTEVGKTHKDMATPTSNQLYNYVWSNFVGICQLTFYA